MHKTFLLLGALFGGIAVILGAFAAHGLKKIVPADTVATFQTGVQYQMYHSFALLASGILFEKFPTKVIKWAGGCFVAGIILFSGSLYLLTALKATEQVGLDRVGIITPVGGVCFILGWLLLLMGVVRN
jgi:uncharacterized membrane protein YgdD (TMEM256/DUF423 family)